MWCISIGFGHMATGHEEVGKVVTQPKDLSSIKLHDPLNMGSCVVMWQGYTLYLHLQKTYGHQTMHLLIGHEATILRVTWLFSHMIIVRSCDKI